MKNKLGVLLLLSLCVTESAVLAYHISDLNVDINSVGTPETSELSSPTQSKSKSSPISKTPAEAEIKILDTTDITVEPVISSDKEEVDKEIDNSSVLLAPQPTKTDIEPNTPPKTTVKETAHTTSVYTDNVLDIATFLNLLNQTRRSNGLSDLMLNQQLSAMASDYAKEMLEGDFFGHYAPSGDSLVDRANEFGYLYRYLGENLAYLTFGNEQTFLNAWMNSPGHRANILDHKMRETGIAFIRGDFQGESVIMAVQFFGQTR